MNASLKELCVDIQLKRKTELLEKSSNFTILGNQTFESGLTPPSINVGRYLALQFPNCRTSNRGSMWVSFIYEVNLVVSDFV